MESIRDVQELIKQRANKKMQDDFKAIRIAISNSILNRNLPVPVYVDREKPGLGSALPYLDGHKTIDSLLVDLGKRIMDSALQDYIEIETRQFMNAVREFMDAKESKFTNNQTTDNGIKPGTEEGA